MYRYTLCVCMYQYLVYVQVCTYVRMCSHVTVCLYICTYSMYTYPYCMYRCPTYAVPTLYTSVQHTYDHTYNMYAQHTMCVCKFCATHTVWFLFTECWWLTAGGHREYAEGTGHLEEGEHTAHRSTQEGRRVCCTCTQYTFQYMYIKYVCTSAGN